MFALMGNRLAPIEGDVEITQKIGESGITVTPSCGAY